MEKTLLAQNGIEYTLRYGNQNIEIERDDITTGQRKVFVFEDLSIGDFIAKRKEVKFMAYDISINGTRLEPGRSIGFSDTPEEYDALICSEIGEAVIKSILSDFLKKIEFTAPVDPDSI